VTVRVKDGQIINLDISWQYHLQKASLVSVYREHKGGFDRTLAQVRLELRDLRNNPSHIVLVHVGDLLHIA
jgi:hypothetical protein